VVEHHSSLHGPWPDLIEGAIGEPNAAPGYAESMDAVSWREIRPRALVELVVEVQARAKLSVR